MKTLLHSQPMTLWHFTGTDDTGLLKSLTIRSKRQDADSAKRAFEAAEARLSDVRLLSVQVK